MDERERVNEKREGRGAIEKERERGNGRSVEVYAKNYNLLHATAGSPKNASSLSRPFYPTFS